MVDRKRNAWGYRKVAERVRSQGGVCICGRTIDPALPRDHPASASADHLDPVAHGGDLMGEMRNMHRVCNMRRGTRPITPGLIAYLAGQPLEWDTPPVGKRTPRHSRDW